jgi:hypothetical protein
MHWENSKLTSATIRNTDGTGCQVCAGSAMKEVKMKRGESVNLDASLDKVQ